MATARPNMGVGSSSSEHQAGDSSLAAEAGESSVGDPTPLSPTGSSFGAPGCPGYPAAATGASEGDALTPHTPEPEADGGGCDSGEPTVGPEGSAGSEYEMGHGHYFTKKTFHKPTYCHHCTDMLWGLIGQGYICEVCNFVVHDRCLKTVVSPCSTIAINVIKNPVPHCWTEAGHLKRKFCNVCRKRIEDSCAVRCEVCEYCVHLECQDFSVADCKQCATYTASRTSKQQSQPVQYHHWREGNLPANSKCQTCKKACWSAECLAGMRCEWCGIAAHATCYKLVPSECNFGVLESIMLPPAAVSIPRTDVPLETIIGMEMKGREQTMARNTYPSIARSISEEFSSTAGELTSQSERATRTKDMQDDYPSPKEKDKDEEVIKVYDGNASMKRRMFRTITVARSASREAIIAAALRAFHVSGDPKHYVITDVFDPAEKELADFMPVQSLTRREGKRPAIFLRYKPPNPDQGFVKVFPGKLRSADIFRMIPVTSDTSVEEIMVSALDKFGLDASDINKFRLSEVTLDKGSVHERVMDNQECPWELLRGIARESIRQKDLTRFYLQQKEDCYSATVALFIGNLPPNLSQRQYEKILLDLLGKPYKFKQIGPIYYEYGSLVVTYDNADIAVKAFYMLRETTYEEKNLLVLLLPNLIPDNIPEGVRPLLVFVNVKSGGCQGLELITSFRKMLNPYQVYDLENSGPLPGLYVFRHVRDYKILVCGGDGTVGWVLQCLDNVGQDSECQSPPCAIVPLGTGNDLARVLRWGPGYTGGGDPMSLLRDVIDAEEIRLDRWTVVFHTDEKDESKQGTSNSTSEDNTAIFVMNNYFGIGIDADLCLDFHNAREENPNKFNSRLHNKGVYVKMGLRKMVSRKTWRDLHREVKLEVDGKTVELPPVEGIIILNILSWGSGANPWGPERDDAFSKPTHYDGMLEVVGVTGVVHMGQIQGGMRSAIRIAQGGHLRIRMNTEMPVQVDGEPWIQPPGEVVVLRSALKAIMLRKKPKPHRIHRRNTEPTLMPTSK
ncbi:diacylglycerol kinase theta-like isoform X2 [Varroa jacobsoni]|uniref:diacylglycerol kinase theta-like isoform X2 n=1 Tax=Varroa jacobsoni TaxID=62625 RepID=UPI000BF9D314|nr:diacylglycerol kinase theta-like isoform X2 [Varroa jacobsoni]